MKGIVTICGSSRFKREFEIMNALLTFEGWIVLSAGVYEHSETNKYILAEIKKRKTMLDQLHNEKIEMSQFIVVINKDLYIGESTRKEIDYAKEIGKSVYYWNDRHSWFNAELVNAYDKKM